MINIISRSITMTIELTIAGFLVTLYPDSSVLNCVFWFIIFEYLSKLINVPIKNKINKILSDKVVKD